MLIIYYFLRLSLLNVITVDVTEIRYKKLSVIVVTQLMGYKCAFRQAVNTVSLFDRLKSSCGYRICFYSNRSTTKVKLF